MAQRYTSPVAHARMADDRCPECGNAPESHMDDTSISFLIGLAGGCNLLPRGVAERIEQYRADAKEDAR
jgi:hypothetical protein